ncbi:fused MFS/spermidine synthase [Phycicoccus sp. BSK3Z-2]|uniref:Fused MFS/spermidine synthase n=1 Tax=Phycicoccus avicenniae TaxID=2828860 RepID=A0A941I133_9MICO|nr:fused MFS/spermidine synthase [Phycicoccus avicenniae]
MGDVAASVLVFGSSCAVLVVEIVALRLLAPYFGLTLETSTLVIGLALAAIAAGAWLGGRWADGHDARGLLGRLLYISGAVVAATPFLVRGAGSVPDSGLLLPVTTACIVVPGALLSAMTPMVTKLRLATLEQTGSVVGRLSGIGTAGAITGTVVTGFVLISTVPVTWIMVGLGVLLAAGGVATEVHSRRAVAAATAAGVLLVGAGGALLLPSGCDYETTYHCAVVQADPDREGGLSLVLDNLRHSYVDVGDPEYLEFSYVKALAAATEASYPAGEAIDAHHLGGGGLTLPRWLATTRPGTTSTVSEIDPGVVEVDEERLGLETGPDLEVRVEDARTGLDAIDDDSRDLVVGDAFGGVSVPWHLTTVEVLGEVRRVLGDDGLYAANLIDYPPLGFARAEVETLGAVFDHVALAATPASVRNESGGNLVALASDAPIDTAAWQEALDARDVGWQVIEGAELDAWVGDSPVLTDDYAPVDQLLTPYPSARAVSG